MGNGIFASVDSIALKAGKDYAKVDSIALKVGKDWDRAKIICAQKF